MDPLQGNGIILRQGQRIASDALFRKADLVYRIQEPGISCADGAVVKVRRLVATQSPAQAPGIVCAQLARLPVLLSGGAFPFPLSCPGKGCDVQI